jgi:hypothetical protein
MTAASVTNDSNTGHGLQQRRLWMTATPVMMTAVPVMDDGNARHG